MWISRHMWFNLCYEVGAMRERLNNIENYLGLSQSDKSDTYFTEMDLHCIARLIQSSFEAPEQEEIETYRSLYGCMYCKYAMECGRAKGQKGEPMHFRKILKKLEAATGVRESTIRCTEPYDIDRRFFPGSYYIEHPEVLYELEKVHPKCMMDDFKACLEKVIAYSKEKSS